MNIKSNILLLPLLAAIGIIVIGCTRTMPEPESDAFKLYEEKCSICHPVYNPKIIDKKTWVLVVKRMEKKVKVSQVRNPLTVEEKAIILNYLQNNSRERRM